MRHLIVDAALATTPRMKRGPYHHLGRHIAAAAQRCASSAPFTAPRMEALLLLRLRLSLAHRRIAATGRCAITVAQRAALVEQHGRQQNIQLRIFEHVRCGDDVEQHIDARLGGVLACKCGGNLGRRFGLQLAQHGQDVLFDVDGGGWMP